MTQQYDPEKLFSNETVLQRYIRLTVGEGAGLWALFWHELLLGLCTGLPGLIGLGMRNKLYASLFKGFDKKAYLGRHVTLRCPRQIALAAGVVIDDFVQLIATSRQQGAIRIGQDSFIRSYAMINAGPPDGFVHIGENSSVGQGSILYGHGGLVIGDDVMIAGQCFIVASSHNYDNPDVPMRKQGYAAKGITINNNVWIGAGAKILDGVTIGEGAIIGANAVVASSVPTKTKVGGVPARELRSNNSSAD